jgi:hypothetical protein
MTKKKLCKTQEKLSLAESIIREKEEEEYEVMRTMRRHVKNFAKPRKV